MSKSNSKSQSDVDIIIKEFLFNSLSNEQLEHLKGIFSKSPNNFKITPNSNTSDILIDIFTVESNIVGSITSISKDNLHLKDLKNSDKCFLLLNHKPSYRISKIVY